MSNDMIPRTPAEENPWYKLAIMPCGSEPSNHIWNGYMRFLMEHNGEGADEVRVKVKVKVKVILNDGKEDYKEVGLPNLTPNELTSVQAIIGLLGNIGPISFENCDFDNSVDFVSFYFPTDVSFKKANFEGWADFRNASFGGGADFSRASFPGLLHFRDVSFGGKADFKKAIFECPADFTNASFVDLADFTNASFEDTASFENANFEDSADFIDAKFASFAGFTNASFKHIAFFDSAKFKGRPDFTKAKFEGGADFKKAIFEDQVVFNNASFAGSVGFSEVSFEGDAYFSRANFEGAADFKKASFAGEANFSASSDTPPHKGFVSFVGATFKQAPAFFERQLHEDIDWQGADFPKQRPSKEQAGDDVRRYECLSLMMSKLEKYDDMHTFFRLSMRAKEIRDGRWSVTSLMSRIYGTLFDYGWGVGRAFFFWFVHIVLGSLSIMVLLQCKDAGQALALSFNDALMLSFSNAHSFIGLHSGAQMSLYDAARAIPLFNFIWSVQTVFGLPLLFFLLLTIRNRFRMR